MLNVEIWLQRDIDGKGLEIAKIPSDGPHLNVKSHMQLVETSFTSGPHEVSGVNFAQFAQAESDAHCRKCMFMFAKVVRHRLGISMQIRFLSIVAAISARQ